MLTRIQPAIRLWAKVEKQPGGGCWLFTGSQHRDGYGQIRVGDRIVLAHRLAWELTYGPIPEGQDVLHSCDTPPCVCLDHLHLGNPKINAEEMMARGRHRASRGEQHGRSKLTETQVHEIRCLYEESNITKAAIARCFGVSEGAVRHILAGRRWARQALR